MGIREQIQANWRRELNRFLGALMFLTRIPVGASFRYARESAGESAGYFPLVGLIVGALGAAVMVVSAPGMGVKLAALLGMLTTVLVTGALHEDGLSDAADGLIGGNTPARRLEIMRDSRIGTYGALALWFSLSARWALLLALLDRGLAFAALALMAAQLLGRAACVGLLYGCRYARTGESKSQEFGDSVSRKVFRRGMLVAVVLSLGLLGRHAFPCLFIAVTVTLVARRYFEHKLGGVTGDCLGACNQFVELACYLVLLGGR